jgi:cytochrome c oxidase cbb3-type subunit 3
MKIALSIVALAVLTSIGLSGCESAPGQPVLGEAPTIPSAISDFTVLYGENCSGCHGQDGKGGAAIALANPVYLALVDDATLRNAASDGIPGTSMPAFAQSVGGLLTDKQIDLIVDGMRQHWSKPVALDSATAPPYSSSESGNASRGLTVYTTYCQSCHGIGGHGSQQASSIVDGAFLALVTDQELRTIVIVGRPELGAPDWRSDAPGHPMSPQDVSDVVAWLEQFPGQPYPSNPSGPPNPSGVKSTGANP